MSGRDRPRRTAVRWVGAIAMAGAVSAGLSLLSAGSASAAVASQVTTRCAVLAQGQSCSFGVSGNPGLPYAATIPAGVSTVTAIIEGGTGANGDDGAAGGAGGIVVETVAVTPGEQLALWVGANGNTYNQPGLGWAAGGDGFPSGTLGSDSGAGGGASAIEDDDSGMLLAVAGGGGGAGGSYNNFTIGGNGGAGGAPAGTGATGGAPPGGPYKGGGGPGGPGGGNGQPEGAAGGAPGTFVVEGGGGGGGGYAGGSGGDASEQTPDAGGGGGAGSSYAPLFAGAQNVAYASAVSPNGGSITLIPGSAVSSFGCVGASTQSVQLASPTATVLAIVAGAPAGNDSDDTSPTGLGAVVTAQLQPDGVQNLAISVGCTGEAGGYGNGGVKGYAGEAAGADGGYGGGGSAIVNPASGNAWLVAGGGGGAGGRSLGFQLSGGVGGNAGLGWASAGAGSGGDGGGTAAPGGGQGGVYTSGGQPTTEGDSPAKVDFEGGGAGAGGGGIQGGEGGDTVNEEDGGGGGGAGASSFDGAHAFDPTVATSSKVGHGGMVVLVQEGSTSGDSAAARRAVDEGSEHTATTATGSLKVSARVAGNDASAHANSVFGVRVLCRADELDVRTPGGATFGLSAGRSRTLTGLPIGARCRIDQINNGQATRSAIRPANVTVKARGTTTTVTNTFAVGTLTLRLTARPGANRRQLARRVPVYVLCRQPDAPASIHDPLPGNGYLNLTAGTDLVLRRVPAGAHCSVAPLDHHYASTARIDRQAIVSIHGHALLRITDHFATPRYRVAIAGPSGRAIVVTARPDDRIVVASTHRRRGISASLAISRLSGWLQIVNRTSAAVTVRVSRNGQVRRHVRVRARRATYIRP